MARLESGVFPVNEIDIKIGVEKSGEQWTYKAIKDMETMSISIETNTETWNPMENKGWQNALVTGKSCTISFAGKRNIGDEGNDFVSSRLLEQGQASNSAAKITFPNGDVFEVEGVISISNYLGGDSTNVAPLEFDLISSGVPKYTKAH